MKDEACVRFLRWALPRLRMRWKGFRKPRDQVCKRIGRRMEELGLRTVDAYRARLESRPEEWDVLDALCRVTISRFYRDRGVWDHLRTEALPDLAASVRPGGSLRAWSAGCGSGEEPYTLSLAWALDVGERHPGVELRVVATDAEPAVLKRARRACYPEGTLRELPEAWRREAFVRSGAADDPDPFCLRERFTRAVELRREDVREVMPAGPFLLILCRNLVFTYFDEKLQRRLLHRILERLAPGGRLVLGAHEELPGGTWSLEPAGPGVPIFQRPAGLSPRGPSPRGRRSGGS